MKRKSPNKLLSLLLTVLIAVNFFTYNVFVKAEDPTPAAVPILLSAATDLSGAQIVARFDKAMADPAGKHAQFTVDNGANDPVTAVALKEGDPSVIVLTLAHAIQYGQTVSMSYTAGDVLASDSGVLASFPYQNVSIIDLPVTAERGAATDAIAAVTIAEARALGAGSSPSVVGVVTYVNGNSYFIQDGTAGINVYISGLSPKPQQGDQIKVNGPLTTYHGLLEFTPEHTGVSVVSSANPLPEPNLLTIAGVNTGSYESQLVKIENVTLGTINTIDTTITDAAGNYINLYKLPALSGISAGDKVDVIAVASNYDGPELLVRSAADITLSNNPVEAPLVTGAATDASGAQIEIHFSKAMADPTGKATEFTVNTGADNPVTTVSLKAGDASVIVLTLTNTAQYGQAITLTYAKGTVAAADGSVLESFTVQSVTNNVIDGSIINASSTIIAPIKTAQDDMEEWADGSLDWDSSDLEIGWEKPGDTDKKPQQIGLRFAGLSIPQGATITNAYIQFYADAGDKKKSTNPLDINIYAEDDANAPAIANQSFNISSRTKTGDSVHWYMDASDDESMWKSANMAGSAQQTPNIASLVQKIVDKDAWNSDNAITFIMTGSGNRTALSFEGAGSHSEQVPCLHVTYNAEAAQDKSFDIVEITDLHGNIGDASANHVAAVMAANFNYIEANNPGRTLILSAGDNYQGTAISNLQYGEPVMKVFNAMGLDATTLGNHEFDWGLGKVTNVNGPIIADYPIVCANLFPKGNTTTPVFAPYKIFTLDGVKIAVVGGITESTPGIVLAANIVDYDLLSNVTYISHYAQQARNEGAELVIALIHEGDNSNNGTSGPIVDIARQLVGVDAVLGGHSHSKVQTTVTAGDGRTLPLEIATYNGKGYIDLKVTRHEDGTFTFNNATSAYVAQDTTSTDYPYGYKGASPVVDTQVQQIVADTIAAEGPILNQELGSAQINLTRTQADSPYGETLAGNWATDVLRTAGNAEIAFQNNGGLRCDIPQGTLTYSTIYAFMPFDNVVMTCDMTGAQLKTILEQAVMDGGKGIQVSGLKFTYKQAQASGSRVLSIVKSDGTPIDMADKATTYKVATNDFLAGGTSASPKDGFTFASESTNMTNTYALVRDALADAVKAAGSNGITAGIEGRIHNNGNAAADTVSKVTAAIHGDPTSSEGFTWYTGTVSQRSDLQVLEK